MAPRHVSRAMLWLALLACTGLARAAEPLPESGLAPDACRGPGRLCRALHIDTRLSGRHLHEPGSGLWLREGRPPGQVSVSPRVGIRHAVERPLRFFDAASAAVSRFHTRAARRRSARPASR